MQTPDSQYEASTITLMLIGILAAPLGRRLRSDPRDNAQPCKGIR